MSNERPRPDSTDVSDPLVSQVYRETADERVPEELDCAVLSRAASAANPRYARSILWLRPLAWTATVGLCLAIVVELSQLPEQAVFDGELAEPDSEEETELLDTGNKATVQESGRQDLDSFASGAVSSGSTAETEIRSPASVVTPATTEQNLMERKRVDDSSAGTPDPSGYSPAESFEARNPRLLQQAEDMARAHSENAAKSDQAVLRSVAADLVSPVEHAAECDEDASTSPTSWLECIEDLEDAGLADAAQRERERLSSVFPDFEMP